MSDDARTKAIVAKSTKTILSAVVDPKQDMVNERSKATFNPNEVAAFLHGGQEKLQQLHLLTQKLQQLDWGDKSTRYFLTREEEYVGGLNAAFKIWELMKREGLSLHDGLMLRKELFWPGGLELHIGMFIPTIQSQGTPEQQAYWLDLSLQLKIIGTYAQTELGHGTYVRGLETTATYDEQSEEFVVHSPTLTSTKWWPGGLGKTATHVILMARLFTKGRDYGPHAFVVQIRDMNTHLPLAGIKVGDIGAKMGYNGVDNGFLSFDHFRIPRDAMLMRFAKVAPDGTYTPPPAANSKASYATMVYVRATIVEDAGSILSRAVTIAVRYNAVRRQMSPLAPGQPELQVIDYQNSSYTLFPLVASAYALFFMGQSMMKMYRDFEKNRDAGDFSTLPELHALSSGLKGDNNVMCLQTARYLVKAVLAAQQGKGTGSGSAGYLQQPLRAVSAEAQSIHAWKDVDVQLAALCHRAHQQCESATRLLAGASPSGRVEFEGAAWNGCTVALISAAKAHCLYALHANFVRVVRQLQDTRTLSKEACAALMHLAQLHGLHLLQQGAADLMEVGYISGEQARQIREALYSMLLVVRPNAVALVDSFGVSDYLLNSALGRKDGDVYQALYNMAQLSPLNKTLEGPAWQPVLQKYLASDGPRAKL